MPRDISYIAINISVKLKKFIYLYTTRLDWFEVVPLERSWSGQQLQYVYLFLIFNFIFKFAYKVLSRMFLESS
jgi:hypothetical protein